MTKAKISAALVLGGVIAVIAVKVLHPPAAPLEPPPPFSFAGGRLILVPDSPLLTRLEILEVGGAAEESREYRAVGQILALSNTSGNLTGEQVGWVELDPALSASVGVKLNAKDAAGTAYGLTTIAAEYAARVEAGQRLEIMRYGLKRSNVSGRVVRIIRRPEAGDRADVVFRFTNAQDWFPGTNCEVSFPVLTGHPVRIPTTAPIHEGTQEYVWKEVAPAQFTAQNVSMVDATPDEVSVLGLHPGDRIVGRGAILLKPLLKRLLAQK